LFVSTIDIEDLRQIACNCSLYTDDATGNYTETSFGLNQSKIVTKNQTFHYTRRITPKRVTSWRCPSPRIAKIF